MFADFYNRHPIATWVFGIGAGIVLLFWIGNAITGGGSSSSASDSGSVVAAGPSSDAQLNAATNLQLASMQIQADAQAREDNNALEAAKLAVSQHLADLNYNLSDRSDERAYNLGVAQLNERGAEFSITAGLQQHEDDLNAGLQRDNIAAQRDTQLALIQSNVTTAQIAGSVAKKQSSNGLLGSIFGGLFSDERLKENREFAFVCGVTGLRFYHFDYTREAVSMLSAPTGRQLGVMAQEVLMSAYADVVTLDRSGFYKVDYDALRAIIGEVA